MTRSTLEGVAELTKQLNALKSLDDGKAMRMAVRAGMKPAFEQAKATIPVGSMPHRLSATYGRLLVNAGYARNALRMITTINGAKNIASAIIGVRKPAFYASLFVEVGTRKMRAQPWLRRSLIDRRENCEEAFRAAMHRALDRAVRP